MLSYSKLNIGGIVQEDWTLQHVTLTLDTTQWSGLNHVPECHPHINSAQKYKMKHPQNILILACHGSSEEQ